MGRGTIFFQCMREQGNLTLFDKDGKATVYRCDNCGTEFALIPKE